MIGASPQLSDDSKSDLCILNPSAKPTDSVACLSWSPVQNSTYTNWFVSSSWDSKIHIYDIVAQNSSSNYLGLVMAIDIEDPCLSASFMGNSIEKLLVGSIDNSVKTFDLNRGSWQQIGGHFDAVKGAYYIEEYGVIASVSYDKTIKFWDLRQSTSVGLFSLPGKVYCSDFLFPYLACGLSNSRIMLMNFASNLPFDSLPCDYVDSPLGLDEQLTCLSIHPDRTEIALGSICGRCNVSTIIPEPNGRHKLNSILNFKGHKREVMTGGPQKTLLYPINSVGLHPSAKGSVFTAGSEGVLTFWDYHKRSKVKDFNYQGRPVTKAKLSPNGAHLAYAVGYDWARGIDGAMSIKPDVYVHTIRPENLLKN